MQRKEEKTVTPQLKGSLDGTEEIKSGGGMVKSVSEVLNWQHESRGTSHPTGSGKCGVTQATGRGVSPD